MFLQGWPDNSEIWDTLHLSQKLKDVRVVLIDLPNTKGKVEANWGSDFNQIVADLFITLSWAQRDRKDRTILVAHDWGCFYGYMFDQKYPKYFSHMVMLDVPAKA